MIESGTGAVAAGVTLSAISLLAMAFRPARPWVPEILALASIAIAAALGLLPGIGLPADAWSSLILQAPALPILAISLSPLLAARTGTERWGPSEAAVAGLLLGPLAATTLVASNPGDPRRAARLVLLASTAGALSPLAPAPLILAQASVNYSIWALPPCLLSLALVWPGRDRPRIPRIPTDLLVSGLVAIGSAWAFGPLAGTLVAALGFAIGYLATRKDGETPPPSPGSRLVRAVECHRALLAPRMAVAALMATALAQASGGAWFAAEGAELFVRGPTDGLPVVGIAAVVGCLIDPFFAASFAERALAFWIDAPPPIALATALALASGPFAWLAWASTRNPTFRARYGLLAGLVPIALSVVWIALSVRLPA